MSNKTRPIPENLEFDKEAVNQYKVFQEGIIPQIDKLEYQIKVLKQSVVSEGKQKLPLSLISNLYYETQISTDDIIKTFGITNRSMLRQIIGNYIFKYLCSHCDKELMKEATSRTKVRELLKNAYDYLPNKCPDCTHPLCSDCYTEACQEYADKCKASRIKHLKAMPYDDYLQTTEWQSTKIKMLQHANHKCQLCSRNMQLHVHHNNYDCIGEETYADLIVLCADCHAKHHDKFEERNE